MTRAVLLKTVFGGIGGLVPQDCGGGFVFDHFTRLEGVDHAAGFEGVEGG